jgi:hypothetical protein
MTDNTTMQLIPRRLIDIIEKAGGAERPDLWAPETEMSELFRLAGEADPVAALVVAQAAAASLGIPPMTAEQKRRIAEEAHAETVRQMEKDPIHMMAMESNKVVAELAEISGIRPEILSKIPVVELFNARTRLAFRAKEEAAS